MKRLFLLASVILAVTFSSLTLADKRDGNRSGSESRQMTGEEIIISKNSYVKPYLPAQIVGKNIAYGPCGPEGNLDRSARGVNCYNVSSVDRKQTWRFRHVMPGGTIDRIWKIQNNNPVLWAVFDKDNGFAVVFASSDARQFATAHGLTPQDSPAQAPTNSPYSPSPAPTATNPVENILKNGVSDLLKGLGR